MAIHQYPWPEWVEAWLKLPFYETKCRIHGKKYTTVYCGACKEEPICEICWKHNSKLHHCDQHPVLQVCIASRRTAIAVPDIRKFLDISEIQPYVINYKEIMFLNPHKEGAAAANYSPNCQTCQRRLKPDNDAQAKYKFCSIACKLIGNNGGDLKIEKKSDDPAEVIAIHHPKLKLKIIYNKRKTMEINVADRSCSVSSRKRSRKGIPHRAPFQ